MPAAWLKGLLCSNDNEDENDDCAAIAARIPRYYWGLSLAIRKFSITA